MQINDVLDGLGIDPLSTPSSSLINFTQVLVVKPIPTITIDGILLKKDIISLQVLYISL